MAFNTHWVIKISDAEKHLTDQQLSKLVDILGTIEVGRNKEDKPIFNKYLVINQDEPYADEVIEIMKKHGHWGVNDMADPLDGFIEKVEDEEKALKERAAEIAETVPVPYHIVLGTLMEEARRGGAEKCLSYQGLDEIDLNPPERQ